MCFKDKFHYSSRVLVALVAACFLAACGDSLQVNSSPLFDSPQGWSANFAKVTGRGPGVVVGPGADNLLTQTFFTKPNVKFKIVARALSVDKPKAMGRLQVNWYDQNDKFIATSIKVIEVTSEEKNFESDLVSPVGTASGILYVTAHGPGDVVRYTEMRLLKN